MILQVSHKGTAVIGIKVFLNSLLSFETLLFHSIIWQKAFSKATHKSYIVTVVVSPWNCKDVRVCDLRSRRLILLTAQNSNRDRTGLLMNGGQLTPYFICRRVHQSFVRQALSKQVYSLSLSCLHLTLLSASQQRRQSLIMTHHQT